ncbi:MAG: chromate transporter, chromate ion transporter family [Fibrobacteres bacterium]|nr:chromate transporter, chromate ion transporter family [Fibrobacterota bacterium]
MRELLDVSGLFLKLGLTAFGGPAAHIALMRREAVERRKWLTEEAFLDLLGATNLIPGPNSTEMAIHIGYLRAGWPGLLAAGISFIVPAMLMVSALAWIYLKSGTVPQIGWLLYGVKPVVIALILHAVWGLGRKGLDRRSRKIGFIAVLTLYFAGANEIALLFGTGLAFLAAVGGSRGGPKPEGRKGAANLGPPLAGTGLAASIHAAAAAGKDSLAIAASAAAGAAAAGAAGMPFTLTLLFLKFLKIGSVLYGSGYVLLPFLRSEFVERAGWLSESQVMDAVSVGQVTPGPFFTTATFIGHVLGGFPGGALATLGIFLPAFVFVAVSNPWIPRLRESKAMGGFLDGVNTASIALMAGAAWETGKASVVDGTTAGLAVLALYLLFRRNAPGTLLIAGGGLMGIAAKSLG